MKKRILWFEMGYKTLLKTILGFVGGIIALSGVVPEMQNDIGKVLDKIYMGISAEWRIIIGVSIFLLLLLWNAFDWWSNQKEKELLLSVLTKQESEEDGKNNEQRNSGGTNLQDINVGRDLILYPTESKEKTVSTIKVKILPSDDEKEKGFILKRVRLINQDSKKLISCYVTAISISLLPLSGDFIKLASNDMVWAKSNSRISDNKVDLVEGIPADLYVTRVSEKKKVCEIFGINGLHTSIEKGEYVLRLRLDGENFESPKAFSIEFYYDGKKSLKFKKLSELSDMAFLYSSVGAGLHKMKFNS